MANPQDDALATLTGTLAIALADVCEAERSVRRLTAGVAVETLLRLLAAREDRLVAQLGEAMGALRAELLPAPCEVCGGPSPCPPHPVREARPSASPWRQLWGVFNLTEEAWAPTGCRPTLFKTEAEARECMALMPTWNRWCVIPIPVDDSVTSSPAMDERADPVVKRAAWEELGKELLSERSAHDATRLLLADAQSHIEGLGQAIHEQDASLKSQEDNWRKKWERGEAVVKRAVEERDAERAAHAATRDDLDGCREERDDARRSWHRSEEAATAAEKRVAELEERALNLEQQVAGLQGGCEAIIADRDAAEKRVAKMRGALEKWQHWHEAWVGLNPRGSLMVPGEYNDAVRATREALASAQPPPQAQAGEARAYRSLPAHSTIRDEGGTWPRTLAPVMCEALPMPHTTPTPEHSDDQ